MYSQYDEEKAISDYFGGKKDGRFLDLGAYDGKTFSNTFALAECGWRGVCVEASPQCFYALQKTYRANPNINLVCAAVNTVGGLVKLHDSGGAVASLDEAHYEKWKDNQKDFMDIYVQGITTPSLKANFGGIFHFISIDIEGLTLKVLASMILEYTSALWCIEAVGSETKEVEELMKRIGYRLIHQTQENVLWGK